MHYFVPDLFGMTLHRMMLSMSLLMYYCSFALATALPHFPSLHHSSTSPSGGLKAIRDANSSLVNETNSIVAYAPPTLPTIGDTESIIAYLDTLDGPGPLDAVNSMESGPLSPNLTSRDYWRDRDSHSRGVWIVDPNTHTPFNITISACVTGDSVIGTWTGSDFQTRENQTMKNIADDLTSVYNGHRGGITGLLAMQAALVDNLNEMASEQNTFFGSDDGVCAWDPVGGTRRLLIQPGTEAFLIILVATSITGPSEYLSTSPVLII